MPANQSYLNSYKPMPGAGQGSQNPSGNQNSRGGGGGQQVLRSGGQPPATTTVNPNPQDHSMKIDPTLVDHFAGWDRQKGRNPYLSDSPGGKGGGYQSGGSPYGGSYGAQGGKGGGYHGVDTTEKRWPEGGGWSGGQNRLWEGSGGQRPRYSSPYEAAMNGVDIE